MWVGDGTDFKLYAYNLASKDRDADNDFILDAGNNFLTFWNMVRRNHDVGE